VEAMKKGAFDFISKPFSPEDLRTVIGRAIEYIRSLEDIAHEKSRMGTLVSHSSQTAGHWPRTGEKQVALRTRRFLS